MSAGKAPFQVLLVAINAKYAHTGLAVRSILGCLEGCETLKAQFAEFTVNQPAEDMLEAIVAAEADAVAFSCYVWNVGLVERLGAELRKLRPGCALAAGGPEPAGDPEGFLARNPAFGAVLPGEGEAACPPYFLALAAGAPLESCPGLVLPAGRGQYLRTAPAPLPQMDALPFPYRDVAALAGRVIYYESMRGCPYRCSYCMAAGGRVRAKSLGRTKEELRRIMRARPRRVKLCDRTFNCDPARALALWRFLADEDTGATCFHFELSGELLDEETLDFLAGVRPGLFQFEVGVQSTNPATLRAVGRGESTARLFENLRRLRAGGNIHLHLDLIAGLPFEDAGSLARSFNTVYALHPHQLQLGFLKVLKGRRIEAEAEEHGLLWRAAPPYEVLASRWLSYEELAAAKRVAAMVELYHNSGRFTHTVGRLAARYQTPWAFYTALAAVYDAAGHRAAPPGKREQYALLGALAAQTPEGATEELQWLCRFDMALHEKPRAVPGWVRVDGAAPNKARALAFYAGEENLRRYLPGHLGLNPGQLLKQAHIEVFPFHPETGAAGECALLFDYSRRDVQGRALCRQVAL